MLLSYLAFAGGTIGIFEDMLTQCYETYCDPRFNYGQAIEMALCMSAAIGAR